MFLSKYTPEILQHSFEHLILVLVAMTIATIIAIPLSIFITRQPRFANTILGFANVIQTIPSLAIFGFLISVPLLGGIGATPAIVALTLYALLPLLRNTYIGITSVDQALKEAAMAMGMRDWQILLYIEIPLAMPVILTGVRVATVICIGIATIAAAIGAGGLGVFIFRGIATVNNELILAGAIPAAMMAIAVDLCFSWLEKFFTPQKRHKKNSLFNWQFFFILGVLAALLIGLLVNQEKSQSQISIGSKNFTEQVVLGEIIAQQIEAKTTLKVDRFFNLGGTFICHEAVKSGQIDGYVEYTGTALTTILKQSPVSNPLKVYQQVKQKYKQQFNLEVMSSLGFNNTFAMVIRGEDARQLKIKTLSEAAKYTPQWKAGFGYEFLAREDGYPGLAKVYGLQLAELPQAMDLGLMYQALQQKKVDLVAGNSTDGLIPVLDLFILEDDKHYFPAYEAVPIFNENSLQKYPEIKSAIAPLIGHISAAEMQHLNYQVDHDSLAVELVVKEFLKSKNIP